MRAKGVKVGDLIRWHKDDEYETVTDVTRTFSETQIGTASAVTAVIPGFEVDAIAAAKRSAPANIFPLPQWQPAA